jgi:hypothetical protein
MSLIERLRAGLLGPPIQIPHAGGAPPLPPGVVLRRGSLLPRLGGFFARMGGPAAAVTLGRTIVFHPGARVTRELLAHELEHVRQWREDALFPLRYTLATLRHGYHANPYEQAARAAARAAASSSPVEDPS